VDRRGDSRSSTTSAYARKSTTNPWVALVRPCQDSARVDFVSAAAVDSVGLCGVRADWAWGSHRGKRG
jgi:hypothetical protein